MKIDTIKSGGQSQGGLDNSGGTLSGPLLLCRNPELPLEAATKQYVDQGLQSLSASNFTTGTLPISRLPAASGDVTSEAGSNIITLSNTGVTPGSYPRVTVNAKGRVTGTGIISATDVPALHFSKIDTNKPTTMSGYGITDAVSVNGGIMTGPLILAGNPTNGGNLVPKQYVDGLVTTLSSANTGDVVRKAYPTTPVGFLKCNGAEVSKTDYANLYAVIGNSYVSNRLIGNGKPWQHQYGFNTSQTQELANWTTTGSLPSLLRTAAWIVTKNRVYILGGSNDSIFVSTVYTCTINADGTLGAWGSGTSLPIAVAYHQAVVYKNTAYIIGGYIEGSGATNQVYMSQIKVDGTLGSWVLVSNLPSTLFGGEAIVIGDKLYVIGGAGGSGTPVYNTVYVSTFNSNGTIGTWSSASALPVALSHTHASVIGSNLYVFGGRASNGTSATNTIYSCPINSDNTIGTWVSAGTLPGAVDSYALFVTKSRVYICGGYNGGSYISAVYSAPINSDGSLGTWITGASTLAYGVSYSAFFTTTSKAYMVSGISGGTGTSNIQSAIFGGGLNDYSAYYKEDDTNYLLPGSGQPWVQQYQFNNTQIGNITGWGSSTGLPATAAGNAAFATKNRVYVCGGYNGSAYINTVQTAPINSDGTLGTWTTSTNLPIGVGNLTCVSTKNRIHLIGGDNGSALSSIYTAPINTDGTIGTWAAGTSLPGTASKAVSFLSKNRLYVIANTGVYTCPVNSDGSLGTWTTSFALPTATYSAACFVTKNRVYVVGGYNGAYSSNIYTATINSDGFISQWSLAGNLPNAVGYTNGFICNNYVYLIGGVIGSSYSAVVHHAPVLTDGTIGTWTTGSSLPGTLGNSGVVVTKNRVYVCGGSFGTSGFTNAVYVATISEGLNDYSPYYDGTAVALDAVSTSNFFKLPDTSAIDVNGIYHYIKT